MEKLRQLVRIVNRNKVKKIDLLDLQTKPDSKINQLYHLISSREAITDAEAKSLIALNGKGASAYSNLKAKLKTRLLNTLFFIDVDKRNYTDRQAAYLRINRDLAAAKILLAKLSLELAVDELEKVLRLAEKFEFTEAALEVARLLRLHSGTRGNEKKYQKYVALYQKYAEINRWENLAEQQYADLMFHYEKKQSTSVELQQLATQYYRELKEGIEKNTSYKFRFYAALVQFYQHTCVNDYIVLLPQTRKVIQFFEQKAYQAHTPIQICLHHQLVAYLQKRDYENGLAVGIQTQKFLEKGSYNWFKNQEYLLILALHSSEYQKAYEHYLIATNHSQFKSLPEEVRDIWEIYRAYLHFLLKQAFFEVAPKENSFSKFRINRFLNDQPHFSKDKRGMNVAILVIQILFYLQEKKHELANDRIEAVQKYAQRHLYKQDSLRSYYFIRLLLCIPRGNFDKETVLKVAKRPLAKFKDSIDLKSNPFHKMEIIPYQKIWEIALDIIK